MTNPFPGPPEGGPPYGAGPWSPYGGPNSPYGTAPYGTGHVKSLDGISIAALVCSLTCCAAPVGVGLGIAGIVRTSGGRRTGRWAAITGLVVGLAGLVVAAIGFALFIATWADDLRLDKDTRAGQCVDVDWTDYLNPASCNDPHDGEIIWVGQIDDALLAEWNDASRYYDDFCLARDLSPQHREAATSGDFGMYYYIDDGSYEDPEVGSWLACYLTPFADGEQLDAPIAELIGQRGA